MSFKFLCILLSAFHYFETISKVLKTMFSSWLLAAGVIEVQIRVVMTHFHNKTRHY